MSSLKACNCPSDLRSRSCMKLVMSCVRSHWTNIEKAPGVRGNQVCMLLKHHVCMLGR